MEKRIRVHCLQHVAEEGLGCIDNWLTSKSCSLSYTRFYQDDVLPQIDDFDFLIVMGGPMGVDDVDKCLFLEEEKLFLKMAIDADKIVLGICLGAQLIASVLGASVYPNAQKEIGWFPLNLTVEGVALLDLQQEQDVFHWHGDTFDLPYGAVLLGASSVTPHQGFCYHEKVVALQFHLEVMAQSLEAMVASFSDELMPSNTVQAAEEILSRQFNTQLNEKIMFNLLDKMVSGIV